MAKIFLSYSSKDKDLLPLIIDPLQELGHVIFYDEILKAGENIEAELNKAMQEADGSIFFTHAQ